MDLVKDDDHVVKGSLVLETVYGKREDWSRKGDFGDILIVGGNNVYSGAPALAGLAALRSGSDLVTIASPRRAADIIASHSPALITHPLDGDKISSSHESYILNLMEKKDSICIGNGAGRDQDTMNLFASIYDKCAAPTVIDADGIYAIKEKLKNAVLTPHIGEFKALIGEDIKDDFDERVNQVLQAAKRFGCVILLKGHFDIISDGKKTQVNQTGNPFMSKGGTGDVLAGITASFLGQGIDPYNAAIGAAFLNGRAGDLVASEKRHSLLPTDIIDKIPDVISSL